MQRADAFYDFLQMPTNAGKSGGTLPGEFWRVRLDGVSGTLGFPLTLRLSLMLISMLVAAMGVNRMLLQRLLGGWALALAFRREVFASLDVSYTAATALPPCRRCRVNGHFIDELVLVTGLAPLETNLRAEPCEKLFATGASPRRVGRGAACDGRAAGAPLALHHLVSIRFFFRRQAYQSLGTREPDQPPQVVYV